MGMFLLPAILATMAVGYSTVSFAHEDDFRVEIEKDEVPIQAGKFQIEFELIDTKYKKVLSDKDLNVVHEKKLHAILFDPALKEFRHEHPEYINSKWVVSSELPKNGNYWLWVQGTLTSDSEEFSSNARALVIGGTQENPYPPTLGDIRTSTDGTSKVMLSNQKIKAKKMVMLTMKFSRTDGTQPSLSPYLGEMAHVISVLQDGDTLVHLHPMSGGNANELMLHAEFPEAGEYRIWAQFIDNNVLKVIPLSVIVSK